MDILYSACPSLPCTRYCGVLNTPFIADDVMLSNFCREVQGSVGELETQDRLCTYDMYHNLYIYMLDLNMNIIDLVLMLKYYVHDELDKIYGDVQ